MSDVELVWDAECRTTESPVWDALGRRVLFVDTRGGRVLGYGVDDGARQIWQLPESVYSFGLCASGRLVVALPRKLVFLDLATGTVEAFTGEIDEPELNRFNDGRPGPDGAYWVGTLDGRTPPTGAEAGAFVPNGSLYRVRPDGAFEQKAHGFKSSNGIAFSPSDDTVYLSDTANHYVDAWSLDVASGAIADRRRFVDLGASGGRPDGAAVDADGCYWAAVVSEGALGQFAPSGERLATITMPCAAPTMPCFAESHLYVTSGARSREELSATPELAERPHNVAGLFRLAAPAAGAPVAIFADN
jgi:sugar lactone lactonase YvrE